MKNGIDSSSDLTAYAKALKQSGIDFVFRYYSTTTKFPEKRLTLLEAQAIVSAGLELAIFYEDKPDTIGYFSESRGKKDGLNAHRYATQLNQPNGSAIYFTVDSDFMPSDILGVILEYFRGVDQGMREAGGGISNYVIGIYGSGMACKLLKANCPFIMYTCLSASGNWNGSATYTTWDVMQALSTGPLAGLDRSQYDECQAHDAFGQFAFTTFFASNTN